MRDSQTWDPGKRWRIAGGVENDIPRRSTAGWATAFAPAGRPRLRPVPNDPVFSAERPRLQRDPATALAAEAGATAFAPGWSTAPSRHQTLEDNVCTPSCKGGVSFGSSMKRARIPSIQARCS